MNVPVVLARMVPNALIQLEGTNVHALETGLQERTVMKVILRTRRIVDSFVNGNDRRLQPLTGLLLTVWWIVCAFSLNFFRRQVDQHFPLTASSEKNPSLLFFPFIRRHNLSSTKMTMRTLVFRRWKILRKKRRQDFVITRRKHASMLNCTNKPFFTTAPTECIVNKKLSEANRASGTARRSLLKCDARHLPTIGKWHQFVGEAGTKLPNSCVPTQHCGTHAPGWMQGEHPKKEDGMVNRKVCFHWSNNCCRWSVMIKVRNCGGHYVYKLEKPPACYLRFCGDKGHSKYLVFVT